MAKDKRLPLAMTVAALLLAREASALGLGDITLHSALNQPLDAEIALQDVGDLTPDELLAHLADAATFERLGLDRSGFLQNLRFTPVIRGGRGFIHVVSTQPVREPFLNFLLELERPNGHLLREYTVLLDPPGYGAASATRNAPAPAYVDNSVAGEGVAAPRRQRVAAPALPNVQATPGEGRYTVVRNDTLWRIAGRLDSKHSNRQQLMAQLYQLNPQAFVGNDPHRLRVGQVLVLPAEPGQVGTVASAPSPSVQAASAPVANAAPANGGGAPVAASTSPPGPTASVPTDPAAQLGQSQEQLTQLTAEREQLNQRMDQLQQQLTNLQQQLDSRDRQVQDLQRQVDERQAAVPVTPAAAPAVQAPAAVAPAPAPVPLTPVDDNDGTPWYLWLAGALLVLLLLALLLYRRRQRAAAVVAAPAPAAPAARVAVPPMRVAPVIPLVEESDFPELEAEPDTIPPAPLAPAAKVEPTPAVAASVPPVAPASPESVPPAAAAPRGPVGNIDSLDGANIYIAYGRFGQAREMLIKSVQQEPQRRELRLKLMMVLAELGDIDGFLEQEAILRGMGGDPLQIEQLRAKYPAMRDAAPLDEPVPLSAPATEAVPLEPLDDWEGLELDDQRGELDASPQPQPAPAPVEPLADNLNLDDLSLDLDWTSLDDPFQVPSAKSAKTAATTPAPVHEDFHSNLHEFPEITEFDLDGEHGGAFDMGADDDHAHDELLAGLDQARASIDRGDLEQAYRILKGIIAHGDSREQEQARELLAQIA